MSRLINNWPRGLVDLLGLKSSDKAWALADDLVANVDAFDIMSRARMRQTSSSSATFVSGSQNTLAINVPNGQQWFVYGISGGLTAPDSGDVIQVEIAQRLNFVTSITLHQSDVVTATNASQQVRALRWFERPMILSSSDGIVLRAVVNNLTVAPSAVGDLRIVYAPFGTDVDIATA